MYEEFKNFNKTIILYQESFMLKITNFYYCSGFQKCIELYETYRGSYEATKAELQNSPDGKHFDVSVNHIFGRFEKFCDRLKKVSELLLVQG